MLLRVEYTFGPAELYQLMFVLRKGEAADRLATEYPEAVVHRFDAGPEGQTQLMAMRSWTAISPRECWN